MKTHLNTDTSATTLEETPVTTTRILIAGGYGLVGSTIARYIRKIANDVEIIIAGRNPEKATPLVQELGNARSIYLEVDKSSNLSDLGPVDLIIEALHDHEDMLIQKAIDEGIAHIGISKMVDEVAPVTFLSLRTPPKRPIVLLSHWQAGIFPMIAQKIFKQFSTIHTIEATGLYDTRDPIGPMVSNDLNSFVGRALLRRNKKWMWVDAKENARQLRLNDGRLVEALPLATLDVPSLASMSGAPHVRFNMAIGDSIGTLAGRKASHDLYIDIEGTLLSGKEVKQRTLLSCPEGQAHFTALGVLIATEHVLGMNGLPTMNGGLFLPEMFISADKAIERFNQFNITISQFEIT